MSYKILFKPMSLGHVNVKNRIAMAPMATVGLCNPDGSATQRLVDYYIERAKGGVGLIITGAAKVENEIEKIYLTTRPIVSLNPKRFIQTYSELVDAVHAYDTKIFMQLTAGFGRVGNPKRLVTEPVAPSPIPNYWNPVIVCRELTFEEIKGLVKAFGDAAEVVVSSGFDGIEVHAVHEGYLLDQFAISLWNKRMDKYGGDLKGRLALPIEILHTIKERVGKEIPVGLRFSLKSYVKDWGKGGLPGEDFKELGRDVDEGLESAKLLEKEGYDYFNVDAGSYEAWYWAHPPTYMPHGCYLDLSEKLKRIVNVPVIVAGKLDIPSMAAGAIMEGKADMIALGRALLADPYWPLKVLEGRLEDIRPCVGCHVGCLGRITQDRSLSCAVNPVVGKESIYSLKKPSKIKRILIVGGGVAGMEAALVAAARGHDVTLYEQNEALGGHLLEIGVLDFKRDYKRLLNFYEVQLRKLGVKVIFNTEVTTNLIKNEEPDVVIIATGSKPIKPKIKGSEKSNVLTCTDLLLGKKKIGNVVVVLGGGMIGCEIALWLARKEKKVTIITRQNELMSRGLVVPHPNRKMLLDLLALHKVNVITNAHVYEASETKVYVVNKKQKNEMECDTIICAAGLEPENRPYIDLMGEVSHLYAIGDCKRPRNISECIREAFLVASVI